MMTFLNRPNVLIPHALPSDGALSLPASEPATLYASYTSAVAGHASGKLATAVPHGAHVRSAHILLHGLYSILT